MPPKVDLSRYRGPVPYIVTLQGLTGYGDLPTATAANRGVVFTMSTALSLAPGVVAQGATPGAVGMVNLDAYGAPYVFRASRIGDVLCLPDAALLRFEEVRRPDPATSLNVVTVEWVPYRAQTQRGLEGMMVFDLFDPDHVYDYYARLAGAVLAQLQVTNRDMARWRAPQIIPAELLELAATSVGAVFYPEDSERLRRNKVESAVAASRIRGTPDSFRLKFRHLGYVGHVTESWQQQTMEGWADPVRGRVPKYQQASVVFASNQNPRSGDQVSFQVSELSGPPSLYMPAPVTLTFDGASAGESQGLTVTGAVQGGTLARLPVVADSVVIRVTDGTPAATAYEVRDDGAGVLSGDADGVIDYATGVWSLTFPSALTAGGAIEADYQHTDVTYPDVQIGRTLGATVANLVDRIASIPALSAYVEAGVYSDAVPHLIVQSKRSFAEAGNPTLVVSTVAYGVKVVGPSLPDGMWNPPSRAVGWPAIHFARLTNDDALTVDARRSDGSDLFPYLSVGARPGSPYRRSRGAIVFYNRYLPKPGDSVLVTAGGVTQAFTYGGNWPTVPDNGDAYLDSHTAAEGLLAALVAHYGAAMTFARSPIGFDTVAGAGETGAGFVDPTAAWLEVPHGSYVGEPLWHTPTNLVTVHLNAVSGAPASFDAVPQPGCGTGTAGPTPAMDPLRSRVMAELVADVLPVNARVRQWVTDLVLPDLSANSAEHVVVSDSLTVS